MRIIDITLAGACALLASCAGRDQMPPAQPLTSNAVPPNAASTYAIVDLGTLGAPGSGANSINDRGWVSGFSAVKSGAIHAALWAGGKKTDLMTLGGANSGVEWPVPNTHGLVVGISETDVPDPLMESWSCGNFIPADGHTCLGFAWQNGTMTALETLGGNNGFATSANDAGAVVGWAETTVRDRTCTKGHVLQFLPVVWTGKRFAAAALPTLKGDPDGAATGINDRGDVVGISGICDQDVGRYTARHAVLWESGKPQDLGSLGGTSWNTPMAISRNGTVVGFSDLPGDKGGNPNFHAFVWTKSAGKMSDLGTLSGDAYSEALGVNDRGQVVGVSYSAGFKSSRGFLWQNGSMVDANTLIGSRSASISIQYVNDVNDKGQIAGGACTLKATKCAGPAWAFIGSPAAARASRP